MQNLIAMLSATTPPVQAAAPANAPREESGSSKFAKLLGDAPKEKQQQNTNAKTPVPAKAPVQAQEVDPDQAATLQQADQEKITTLLSKVISPDDAKDLMAQLEAMHQTGEDGLSDEAFDQLKDALQDLQADAAPTDVATLIETLPAVATAKDEDRAPVIKRLLGWMQHALEKKEAPQQVAGSNSALQSLQASLFPAGDDAAAATQTQDDEQTQAADATITVVTVPLAQTQAMPEWVKKLGAGEENIASDEINDAIPALTLPTDTSELPDVNLPGLKDVATAGAKDDAGELKISPKAFREQLHALNDQLNVANAATAPVTTDASSVQAVANVQQVNHTQAAAPLSHAGMARLTPHTTAMEQVQVAITSGTKDGMDKIMLQLEPADLGRVEVSMQIGADGKTHLSFLVDKPETMDALSRDARSLERSLQEAGIKSDAGSMEFNLRQQPQPQFGQGFGDSKGGRQEAANDHDDDLGTAPLAALDGITKHYTINVREGVDIHA